MSRSRTLVLSEEVRAFLRESVQKLAEMTGVSCSVIDSEGGFLAEQTHPSRLCRQYIHPRHLERCQSCDAAHCHEAKGPLDYRCWAGLIIDVVAPVRVNGRLVAGAYAGQFLDHEPTDEEIAQLAAVIHAPLTDDLVAAVRELRVVNTQWLERLKTGLLLFANGLEQGLAAQLKAERLHALQEAVAAVSQMRDLGGLLAEMVERAQEVVGSDVAGLWMVDEATGEVIPEIAPAADARSDGHTVAARCCSWVHDTGRALRLDDVHGSRLPWADVSSALDHQGLHSVLAVPLLQSGKVLGVLLAADGEVAAFGAEDEELLSLFAAQAAHAMANARLLDGEQHRILRDTLASMRAATPDLGQFLDDAVVYIAGAMSSVSCQYWSLQAGDPARLILGAAHGPYSGLSGTACFALGQGIVGYVGATRRTVRARVACQHPAWSGDWDKEAYGAEAGGQRAILCAPVMRGERLHGLLGLSLAAPTLARTQPWYTYSDEKGLRLAADFLAEVLDAEEAQRGQQRLSAIGQAAKQLARTEDLRLRLQWHLRQACQALTVERAAIWLRSHDGKVLRVHDATGMPEPLTPGPDCPWGQGLVGQVALSGDALVLDDADQTARQSAATVRVDDLRPGVPFMALPLQVGSATIGVLTFSQRMAATGALPTPFTAAERQLAVIAAQQVAVAVHAARQVEATDAVLAKMHNAGIDLSKALTRDEMLRVATRVMSDVLGSENALLYLWDRQKRQFVLRSTYKGPEELIGVAVYDANEGLTGTVGQSGLAIHGAIDEIRRRPHHLGKYEEATQACLESEAVEHVMLVPLVRRQGEADTALGSTDEEPEATGPRAVGVLALHNRYDSAGQQLPFTDEDERVGEILGQHIGVMVENSELFEASTALELNGILRSSDDFGERRERLQRAVAQKALALPGVERSSVRLVDGDELYFAAWQGQGWTPERTKKRYRIGRDGIGGVVASTKEPWRLDDVRSCESHFTLFDDVRGHVSAPILSAGQVRGVISVDSSVVGAFTSEHQWLVERLADAAALAMENLDLFATGALGRIEQCLYSASETREVLAEVVREAARLVGTLACSVFLWDRRRKRFVLEATTGSHELSLGEHAEYKRGQGLTGWVGRYGRALRVRDACDEAELARVPLKRGERAPTHAGVVVEMNAIAQPPFLAQPVCCEGQVVGVLRVVDTGSHRFFTPQDEQLLAKVADLISEAFEREQGRQDLAERLKGTEALLAADAAIDRLNDEQLVLEQLLRQAVRLTGCRAAQIRLLGRNQDDLVLRARFGGRPDQPRVVDTASRHFNCDVISTGEPILVPDAWRHYDWGYLSDPYGVPPCEHYGDYRTIYMVPLLSPGKKVLGILYALKRGVDSLTDSEQWTLRGLARRASRSIRQIRALAEARRRADDWRSIHDATMAMAGAGTPTEQLREVLAPAIRIANADRGLVAELDLAGGLLRPVASSCAPCAFDLSSAFAAALVRKGRATILNGQDASACWPGALSLLGVRLEQAGRLLGVLVLGNETEHAFSNSTVRRLQPVLFSAAGVLQLAAAARAEAATEAYQYAASRTGHRITNPLCFIKTNLATLRDTLPPAVGGWDREKALQRIDRCLNHADRAIEGVNAVQQLFRLVQPQPARVDLVEAVRAAVAEAGADGEDYRLDVTGDAGAWALIDPRLLADAIVELIANAYRAMPAGGSVTLSVCGAGEARPRRTDDITGAHWLLTVSDTGPGVPDDAKERIFQPYYTKRAGGTGMGLAVVRKICTVMGCEVWEDGCYGEGARFRIRIPAA